MPEISPMMSHYLKVKEENKNTIVFYRLGDFYEMFFEDAELASRELELTLTGRSCGLEERAPMCGVPYHSADSYIARLIAKGYKVAICDQTENAATAKGLVSREVTRIITPGTVIESSMLDESRNNFICSMYIEEKSAGISFCDISTGELLATEIDNYQGTEALERELMKFQPREILFNKKIVELKYLTEFLKNRLRCTVEMIEDSVYKVDSCLDLSYKQLKNQSPEELQLENRKLILFSLGALLDYLNKTQKTQLKQITLLEIYKDGQFMNVDLTTKRNLELSENTRDKEKRGSLLWVLDKTKTAMGKRLIRSWIERPLINKAKIIKRQDAVQELFENVVLMDELSEQLSRIYDLERIISKIAYGSTTARELRSLAFTIGKIPGIKNSLKGVSSVILKRIYKDLDPLKDVEELIDAAIVEEPPLTLKDGDVIKKGYDEELDFIRSDYKNSSAIIAALEASEKEKTGIPKLKIKYNKVFGYYIEVTNTYKDKVPERYTRKQTLANCERYVTDEIKELEMKVLGAKEKTLQVELMLFEDVRKKVSAQLERVQRTAKMIASLDAILSLAVVARQNGYCKPEITSGKELVLKDSRHPVVEQLMKNELFVANDVEFDNSENNIYTITGPNMAGKSTYMRQIAVITLMAQIGSFIPASYGKIGIVDSIFTRVGASDDLLSGQSTFMVEMSEVATILKNATSRSLLVFDEIGRGTSTFDGMSIARAVVEYVAEHIHAKTLFATHYHELIALEGVIDGVKNYNIAVKKRGDEITFLKRIVRGGSDDSYGIEVAKLAGLPDQVVKRSREILNDIEAGKSSPVYVNERHESKESISEQTENKAYKEVIDTIKRVDVNTLTPIEAMSMLFKLSSILNS